MVLIGKQSVQAKLVGNTLVAAFRNSNPHLIWNFDLERNHSFTLALQGEDGDLELGVTSSKGEFYPVARFASREDAEEAFSTVQKVLMKRKSSRIKGYLVWVAGLAILVMVLMMAARYISSSFSGSYFPVHSTASAPSIPSGVPVPADQVLRPPP